MSTVTGWWHRKSKPAKIESYTRGSFHVFGVTEIGTVVLGSAGALSGPLGGWLTLLVVAHAGLCAYLQARALDWRLGRREQPVRAAVAVAVVTTTASLGVLVLSRTGELSDPSLTSVLLVSFSGFGLAATALALRTARQMACAVLAGIAVLPVAALALGLAPSMALACVLGVGISGTALVFTYAFSAWLVNAVWDLDAARELQGRLAVAEERLRFGRDLHDVMGRNLAVIALKSELAVQLAERGRPEAVVQMTEVQRIARESQREVRDVVRGYREADLPTELEGARAVLKAAGIDCRIEGAAAGSGLAPAVQSALAWVVREATTNVLRHGDARRCTVRLTRVRSAAADGAGGSVVLRVENDGVPVPAPRPARVPDGPADAGRGAPEQGDEPGNGPGAAPGSGLAGLRERLAVLDGTLEAGRVDGHRFRLTARVPVAAAPVAEPAVRGAAVAHARVADGVRAGARVPGQTRSGPVAAGAGAATTPDEERTA